MNNFGLGHSGKFSPIKKTCYWTISVTETKTKCKIFFIATTNLSVGRGIKKISCVEKLTKFFTNKDSLTFLWKKLSWIHKKFSFCRIQIIFSLFLRQNLEIMARVYFFYFSKFLMVSQKFELWCILTGKVFCNSS